MPESDGTGQSGLADRRARGCDGGIAGSEAEVRVASYPVAVTIPEALLGFAVVAALLTVIPGPDTALVLRSSLTRSRSYAFATAGGIQVGTIIWGAAAGAGATALLAASETAYRTMALLGAAYLVWMGISMLVSSLRAQVTIDHAPSIPQGLAWRGGVMGLTTNLLNPKVGVFYLATIPQFVPTGVQPLVMGVLLALVHCVLGMTWSTMWVIGGSALGPRLRSATFVRWIDRITGGVLIAFGARLAFAARA